MASSFEVDFFEVEPYDDPYVRTPLEWCRASLHWEDLGLLTWLRSHQPGFQFTESFIVNASPAGRDKVRVILRRLEKAGYLKRSKIRDAEGKIRGAKLALRATADPVVAALRAAKRAEPSTENPSLGVEQREHLGFEAPQALPTENPSEVADQGKQGVSAGRVLKTALPTLANPQQRKNIYKEPPPPTPSGPSAASIAAVARPEEAEGNDEIRKAAVALVATLPGNLTGGQRHRLTAAVAARLNTGWSAESLTTELTTDLAEVRSHAGLYKHRLAELPADPPTEVSAPQPDLPPLGDDAHDFDPDPADPDTCLRCPRPRENRIHQAAPRAVSAPNTPIRQHGSGYRDPGATQARSGRRTTAGPVEAGRLLHGLLPAGARSDAA
ncbi:hypothetical protein [Glycomyces buryatensis]|uniref:Helix-turn-helix domain-containing protein n=1 Tax=Glycomyces buryatensis TaxID=2570927 RepID=A0A4S8QIK7_9ACTN|nr:hypothetical protein [Glycomyces buryatensis]THV40564.1 hypothetical protein FAB82_14960 [Glycomyces buryatensis]